MVDLASVANTIKTIAIAFSLVVIAYAGLILTSSKDPRTREEWKEIVAGVFIGLSLLFLASLISALLSGNGTYCGG